MTRSALRISSKAARADTRSTNRRLVLQQLLDTEQLSRADLARRTELTAATVSRLITELADLGLVSEAEPTSGSPRVGKPPTMLKLQTEARSMVCLDLSDPETLRAAIVDLGGEVAQRFESPVEGRTGPSAVDMVVALAKRAAEQCDAPLLGIGIGTPGVVTADGVVVEATSFGWHDLALRQLIESEVGVTTFVTNDANSAALAEYSRGDHGSPHLAVVKIGSGVGAGLVLNGHPFVGQHAGAGEIGHLVVDPAGQLCRCGHHGCLETVLATPYLTAAIDAKGADIEAVRQAAAERLGIALAAIVAVLDLDDIFIAGPQSLLGENFCELVALSLRTRCLASVTESLDIQFTSLGEDIVLLGAAALVMSQELGVA